MLGNREHKITIFRFWGNRGTRQFISGEQGNRYPHGRASLLSMECQCKYKKRFVARLPCAVYLLGPSLLGPRYLGHEKKKCEVVSMLPHEQS